MRLTPRNDICIREKTTLGPDEGGMRMCDLSGPGEASTGRKSSLGEGEQGLSSVRRQSFWNI